MEPSEGHRLVEIGCVELMNQVPTGRTYHQYINPERDVPAEAVAVHGLTLERLKEEPTFAEIYTDFLDFVGDNGVLVAHNAAFDMKFINAELKMVGHSGFSSKRVKDSLIMAREKYPGSPASLDALCRRFNIDLSGRELHGALLDAQLLAEVWLELLGGRQHGLSLGQQELDGAPGAVSVLAGKDRPYREPRPHRPEEKELEAHREMLTKLTDPLWNVLANAGDNA